MGFIYKQGKKLKNQAAHLFGIAPQKSDNTLDEILKSIRFFLEGKLETKGSLQGLSNFANSLGIKYCSTNFISTSLELAGSLLDKTYTNHGTLLVTFLCDEVYSGGKPILVTLEAQSMTVLDIRLVEGQLTSSDWEESFTDLSNQQITAQRIIKDQGKQMASAVKVLPNSTIVGADTFHAIPHRLGVFHCQLKKAVQLAEAKESDRATRFANTKTYLTALKKEVEWDIAKANTLQARQTLQQFDEHYFRLIQQLRPFNSLGQPRDKASAEHIIGQSLRKLALLPLPNLQKHLNHIEILLENGQLLHFMEQVTTQYQAVEQILEADTVWLWSLYWQWTKKAYQTHSPKVNLQAKTEALAAKELLIEHYVQNKTAQSIEQFEQLNKQVFSILDEIVQASSLVETFNSILKPFINSTRGQVSQPLLNLVKFYHNHRVFKRGKRQHFAPIELLTGQSLEKHWIDILMDKIKMAFEKYRTTSLKKLHGLICSKQKSIEQKPELGFLKNELNRVP